VQRSPEDEKLTVPELAEQAGVSPSTLRNWATKADPPLARVPGSGRSVLHTWAQLLAFCAVHTELRSAQRVLRRVRSRESVPPDGALPSDAETVRAMLRNLRAAAASNLDAALIATRHAEETARAHREQLEAFAGSLHAYDDLLTQLTAPITLHD
jgi:AcrR family transcriptional regulator